MTERNERGAIIDDSGNLPVSIKDPLESNGAIPVNIQDQHSRALDLKFIQASAAPTTLLNNVTAEDVTINVTTTTGFVDGAVVALFTTTGQFYFGKQVGAIAGNTVTLDTPVDLDYTAGDSALSATDDMAVDGSVTTQIFQVGPVGVGTGVELDITRIMGYIEDGTAMDDALFGGRVALTYGIVLRQNNGIISNIWNIKSNGEFGLLCYDTDYTTKAPAGSFGFRFRNTYAGQSKHGVTIRLEPGDILELLIQDDLTDLIKFNMMAQGHLVTD